MKASSLVILGALAFAAAAPEARAQAPVKEGVQPPPVFSYQPGGRRDPFKDLLSGQTLKDKRPVGRLSDLAIDDVVLMGIVKVKGVFEAIISRPDGFPLTIHQGEALADGYVLAIRDTQVVFRKTKDKGVPLMRPRDVIKEITPEER